VRTWTDQGLLTCLRINQRGDRRYNRHEIDRFLARARARNVGSATAPRSGLSLRRGRPDPTIAGARAGATVLARVADACAEGGTVPEVVGRVAGLLHELRGYGAATFVSASGTTSRLFGRFAIDRRLAADAAEAKHPLAGRATPGKDRYQVAVPIAANGEGGVLLLCGSAQSQIEGETQLLAGVAAQVEIALRLHDRVQHASEAQRRAELLVAASSDMSSQLDLTRVLSQLIDRAMELFKADHAAVFSRRGTGALQTLASRKLSDEYCHVIEHASSLPVAGAAIDELLVKTMPDAPDDPRALELRPALLREGINTITAAPLVSDGEALGALALYHDRHHEWSAEDLSSLEQLARQGASLLRNAQNYSQMATWAAQLQSIQQLGARLTRLRTVREIGQAICAELNQLIDYHNVRVYRIEGDTCIPVAWRGAVGEYLGEEGAQLRLKVGEGITGWVARYGLAQNLGDASNDRRSRTIPGTVADLEESLLLAPMLFEDEVVGVIVLAKLGLNQFAADDLRLLEIYASIAAQAMANADATERLRAQSEALARQLNSQRELLRVTESILGTLDTQALLEEIAERLQTLVQVDNISVDVHDPGAGVLRPIFARGVHVNEYLAAVLPVGHGVGGHVIQTGEAQLVQDELSDPRVGHFPSLGPQPGALIVAPLRSADRVQGVLTIERLGTEARFTEEEFELVKLFAAHVSIALQNAETHRAVELRAETDTLTGLWNHGALTQNLDRLVRQRGRFAMLMVDLDYFKRYNDGFGHQAGNVMLQRIATLLRASCRQSDQVFRFGGDEFAVLLPDTNLVGARTVAVKIQNAVAGVNQRGALPTNLTCSIGIATYPKDGQDGPSIILAADRACYAGKRAGRDRIATAADGLALAAEFQPTEPTPLEPAEPAYAPGLLSPSAA
jgi:diguanylate cyclase (GGDEF)-like protein